MLPDPNDRPTRPQPRSPLPLRFFAVGFAAVALAVFFGLIGYTYFSRTGGSGDGPVPLIKADTRPMKTAPDKPGGMDVPHQDKEIYARLNREAPQAQGTRVERLLPPPESPLPRPRPPEAPAPLAPEIPPAPVLEPPPNAVEVAPPPPAPAPPRPAEAPRPGPTKQAAPPPAPPSQQQAAAPRAAPPATTAPAAGGGSRYRIQLAALRTSEDATREWEKLRRTHMDVLGPLTLNVVRADLGDRGTFYRIQAGPVADEQAAKELCRRLAEKKVGCLVVRP